MKSALIDKKLGRAINNITPNALNLIAPTLLKDIQINGLNLQEEYRLFSQKEIKNIKQQIFSKWRIMDRKRKLPYHNLVHIKNVLSRTRTLAAKAQLSKAELQILELAALFHDFEHGNTHSRSKNEVFSYEELSAILADIYAKEWGLSIKQRLLLYGLIIGTTFSNPSIRPQTRLEKLLVIADLGGFINSSKSWLMESLNVTREIPVQYRPRDIREWLKEQKKFLAYARKRLTPEARGLSWNQLLDKQNVLIEKLISNPEFHKVYTPIIKKLRRLLPSAV